MNFEDLIKYKAKTTNVEFDDLIKLICYDWDINCQISYSKMLKCMDVMVNPPSYNE